MGNHLVRRRLLSQHSDGRAKQEHGYLDSCLSRTANLQFTLDTTSSEECPDFHGNVRYGQWFSDGALDGKPEATSISSKPYQSLRLDCDLPASVTHEVAVSSSGMPSPASICRVSGSTE